MDLSPRTGIWVEDGVEFAQSVFGISFLKELSLTPFILFWCDMW